MDKPKQDSEITQEQDLKELSFEIPESQNSKALNLTRTNKHHKGYHLTKFLWFKIFRFIHYPIIPRGLAQVNQYLRKLVKEYAPSLKEIIFQIRIAFNDKNKPFMKNSEKFLSFFHDYKKIKNLTLFFKPEKEENYCFIETFPLIFQDLAILNTVKYLNVLAYNESAFDYPNFLSQFKSLKALKITLYKDYAIANSILEMLKNEIINNKEFVTRLKKISLAVQYEQINAHDIPDIINMLICSTIQEFSVKFMNAKSLAESYRPGTMIFCSYLKKLKLPCSLKLNRETINNLSELLITSEKLQSLHINSSVLEFSNFLQALTFSRTLRSLHLLGVLINLSSVKLALRIFPIIENTNIVDFLLFSSAVNDLESCEQYVEALDSMLEKSNITKLFVYLDHCPYSVIESLSEVILRSARNGKLEFFFKFNIKSCIEGKIYVPIFRYHYGANPTLFYEVFMRLLKIPQKEMVEEVTANNYEKFFSKNLARGTLDNEHYTTSILLGLVASRITDMKSLDLKQTLIRAIHFPVLKIFEGLPNLESLKILFSVSSQSPFIISAILSAFCPKLKLLEIVFFRPKTTNDRFANIKKSTISEQELVAIQYISSLNIHNPTSVLENLLIIKFISMNATKPEFISLINCIKNNNSLQIFKLYISKIKSDDDDNIDVDLICKLLSVIKLKQNLKKLTILYDDMSKSCENYHYLKFINCMRGIVKNNKNLDSIEVNFPIENSYHYSLEMLKLLEINKNIRKLNSVNLNNFKQGDDIALTKEYNFIKNEQEDFNDFSSGYCQTGENRFINIMPIIISEIFKKYHHHQIEEIFHGLGSDKTELNIDNKKFDLTPNKTKFALNCLSELTSLKKLSLTRVSLNSENTKIISKSLRSLDSLTILKLYKIKIKFEKLALIISSPNLKALILEKNKFPVSNDPEKFIKLYKQKKIVKLILINNEYPSSLLGEYVDEFYYFSNPHILKASLKINSLYYASNEDFESKLYHNLEKLTVNNTEEIHSSIFEDLICWSSYSKLTYIRFHEYWWNVKEITDGYNGGRLVIGNCDFKENDLEFLPIVIRNGLDTIDLTGNKKIFNDGGKTVCNMIEIANPYNVIFTDSGYYDLSNDEKACIQEACDYNAEII
ncbi:hypothetical protein SteCoe_31001 [Stentor coeruleus]|uniref:Uncharacterized protein n=1 Tax=Stentor coeruleus TaxID=5963 RepID=A0A1R2B2A5_9CILI|nr:hypothetical protein SteCoe_31001 [Stentor coeruleus]